MGPEHLKRARSARMSEWRARRAYKRFVCACDPSRANLGALNGCAIHSLSRLKEAQRNARTFVQLKHRQRTVVRQHLLCFQRLKCTSGARNFATPSTPVAMHDYASDRSGRPPALVGKQFLQVLLKLALVKLFFLLGDMHPGRYAAPELSYRQ